MRVGAGVARVERVGHSDAAHAREDQVADLREAGVRDQPRAVERVRARSDRGADLAFLRQQGPPELGIGARAPSTARPRPRNAARRTSPTSVRPRDRGARRRSGRGRDRDPGGGGAQPFGREVPGGRDEQLVAGRKMVQQPPAGDAGAGLDAQRGGARVARLHQAGHRRVEDPRPACGRAFLAAAAWCGGFAHRGTLPGQPPLTGFRVRPRRCSARRMRQQGHLSLRCGARAAGSGRCTQQGTSLATGSRRGSLRAHLGGLQTGGGPLVVPIRSRRAAACRGRATADQRHRRRRGGAALASVGWTTVVSTVGGASAVRRRRIR